ncbi:MAG TPA: hypothetical protein VMW63_02105 [Methanoregulaceae archaeon]|nr:hypothetical protein [Methanoregulaceae archaeon]
MRRNVLIIGAIVVIVVVLGALVYPIFFGPSHAEIRSVSTDKELYHSSEVMEIFIALDSVGQMNNTTVRIEGIIDRNGRTRLTHEMPASLSPGPNVLIHKYQLPACSHCAGLDAGTYNITVLLLSDNTVLDQVNHSVRLEQ